MTIQFVAVMEMDGSAIVNADDTLYLVRPPYDAEHIILVQEPDVQKALLQFGFVAADTSFESWSSLIRHLNHVVRRARAAAGQDMQNIDPTAQVLDAAPPDVLAKYLDRVKEEFIASMQLELAEKILLAMLQSDNVMQRIELRSRVVDLMTLLMQCKRDYAAWQSSLHDQFFDSLQRSGKMDEASTLTSLILDRGSIWAFAR